MRESSDIPDSPDAITPGWLNAVLKNTGSTKNASVTSFAKSRIGEDEGFTGGSLFILRIQYDQFERDAPHSLVVKLSPSDAELRAAFKVANGREVQFYTELAPQNNLPVPRCYFGAFDALTGASILLLEDLTNFRRVEFSIGCGPEDAEHVVRVLAKIHAHWWNSPRLKKFSGISILDEFLFSEQWSLYPKKVTELLPDVPIPNSFFALGGYIAANERTIFKQLFETNPITCIHRDIQVDNVLFGNQTSEPPALLLDWQSVGKGRGVYDIAYFIISSLPPEQRLQTEQDLLSIYHTLLVQSGIEGYTFDQCWFDYKYSVVGKIFVTVIATVMLDNSSPSKRAWRQADLERLLAFCEDHSIHQKLFSSENG